MSGCVQRSGHAHVGWCDDIGRRHLHEIRLSSEPHGLVGRGRYDKIVRGAARKGLAGI